MRFIAPVEHASEASEALLYLDGTNQANSAWRKELSGLMTPAYESEAHLVVASPGNITAQDPAEVVAWRDAHKIRAMGNGALTYWASTETDNTKTIDEDNRDLNTLLALQKHQGFEMFVGADRDHPLSGLLSIIKGTSGIQPVASLQEIAERAGEKLIRSAKNLSYVSLETLIRGDDILTPMQAFHVNLYHALRISYYLDHPYNRDHVMELGTRTINKKTRILRRTKAVEKKAHAYFITRDHVLDNGQVVKIRVRRNQGSSTIVIERLNNGSAIEIASLVKTDSPTGLVQVMVGDREIRNDENRALYELFDQSFPFSVTNGAIGESAVKLGFISPVN